MGWSESDIPRIDGRLAIVTGANSGLGFETARVLASRGAEVVLACRNEERGRTAQGRIPGASLRLLDLADLASVQRFADETLAEGRPLDLLVNNAGVMALPFGRTKDGFETQLGVNHLGHYALTGRLLPLLLEAPRGRVVTVSSLVHVPGRMRWDDLSFQRGGYHPWVAYAQSKLANLLFTFELERRLREAGTNAIALAAHPGYAATNLQLGATERSFEGVWRLFNSRVAQSAADGALPTLYAATAPEAEGGALYGPGGPFEMRGSPKRVSGRGRANSRTDAERLWEASERLTGVRFPL